MGVKGHLGVKEHKGKNLAKNIKKYINIKGGSTQQTPLEILPREVFTPLLTSSLPHAP